MSKVELTPEQEKLRDDIKTDIDKALDMIDRRETRGITNLVNEMAKKAHQLHIELKDAGNEPVHNKYILKNRGVDPTDLEFYNHIHPVEDLLAFLEDVNANVEPVDVTIGEEFEFKVYSDRLGYKDVYRLKRTDIGWYINYFGIEGQCDRSGFPILYRNLQHDSIQYPQQLEDWIEQIWFKAKDEGLTKEQVQKALDDIAEWISKIEKLAPRKGVLEGIA
ncbi:MAG: hypothetical protein P9X24_12225 [Candidatus Hatepunaea meridiana]|nr:hypothetical protein [Candidatus Hatepunaea meridiana]